MKGSVITWLKLAVLGCMLSAFSIFPAQALADDAYYYEDDDVAVVSDGDTTMVTDGDTAVVSDGDTTMITDGDSAIVVDEQTGDAYYVE